ncbi:uncharacterized protein LOC111643156 [Copidosoma floridanum]|uniref:uncharacterized protein LOC111643156 n=1 Tax=Copidosoma floridanum TaxID=29053 RepID=UPI000C6FACEE|nr:uncharacterized protein LOC111643156 [Copidosoma floridanum]
MTSIGRLLAVLLVSSIVSSSSCDSYHYHEIGESTANIIAEVSTRLFYPAASISALLCAKTDEVVALSRTLSKRGTAVHYLDPGHLDETVRRFVPHKTIVLLDYDCPWSLQVLTKANDSGLFSAPLKWLILRDSRNVTTTTTTPIDTFGRFAVYPDSEVILLDIPSDDRAEIASVYRPSLVHGVMVEQRGSWSNGGGIDLRDTGSQDERLAILTPTKLIVYTVTLKKGTTEHGDRCQLQVAYEHQLKRFPYSLTVGPFGGARGRDFLCVQCLDGTLMFYEQEIFAFSRSLKGRLLPEPLIYVARSDVFVTLNSGWVLECYRAAFIFRQPPLSFVSNLFTLPFRRSVWLAVGLLLLVIFALLVVSTRWEWTVREIDCPPPTLSDDLLLVIGAVAQQGSGRNPLTVSSRIVVLMLLMAILNLYASYSANIVALLQSTTTSIGTLKDLLDSPIKCGAQDIVYNRHYFDMEIDPIRRAIIEQKIEPKTGKSSNWLSADEGIRHVREGFFAFFMEIGPAYKIIQETFEEDEKCGFREMYFIEHFDPTFTIVKQSPYVEIIRVNSLKIEESGLKSREMLRLYTKRPPCNGRSKFVSVGLRECYFAFCAMLVGSSIALGILFLEVLWIKWIPPKNKRAIGQDLS